MIRASKTLLGLALWTGAFATSAAARPKTIQVDLAGRLVRPIEQIRQGDMVRICIDGGLAANRQVFYRLESEVRNPERLGASNGTPVAICDGQAASPSQQAGQTVQVGEAVIFTYTVVGPLTSSLAEAGEAKAKIRLAEALKELATAQTTLKTERALVTALAAEIGQLGGGAISESFTAIRSRQDELRTRRATIQTTAETEKQLTAEIEGLRGSLEIFAARTRLQKVHRMGAVVVGATRKSVYYEINREGTPQQPFRLNRRWPYPTLYRGDDLYAIVTNAHPVNEPRHFTLSFTSEAGKPPDPAPVRPTIDQGRLGAAGRDFVEEEELKDAQMDVLLSFGRPLKGNEIIKTTISSYLPSITSDKETVITGDGAANKHETVTEATTVKLLDAVEFPLVRDRYHYNLTTGVLHSWLREPTFIKVKTVVGTPAQGDRPATPDEYEVRRTNGSTRVFPVFQFSFYWTPKDIQEPWTLADLIPTPSVGFSLTSAADNVFLGFQSEIRRNVQLSYGVHYGRVTTLGPPPVDENRVPAAPNVTKEFHGKGYVGLSFNLNFVKDLFK